MPLNLIPRRPATLAGLLSGCLLFTSSGVRAAEAQTPSSSFGGELREMVEVYENDSFSPDPDADSTAFLQRYLLHADWRPAARLRFFAELQSAFENGRLGDGDRNALDLHQLFADVVLSIEPHIGGGRDDPAITGGPGTSGKSIVETTTTTATAAGGQGAGGTLTFRIGRQELSYGSQRLIGVRDGTNNRRAFDAIRLIWQSGGEAASVTANPGGGNNSNNHHHNNSGGGGPPIRIDLFAGRPVEWDQGVFDDQTIDGTTLGGLYVTFPLTSLPGLNLDLYWLALDRDDATFSQGTAHEKRQTIGTRFFGKTGAWDFNHEAMLQWGRFGDGGGGSGGDGDILAWSVATDHGFTLKELPGKPRLGLKAAIASGDRDAGDRDLQTFNPLYPRGSYFTEASLLGPQNFMDLRPGLRLQPADSLSLEIGADFYWRQQRADGIYRPSGSVIYPGDPSLSRFVGTDLSFSAEWSLTPSLTLAGAATHFFAGPFITAQGGRDVNYGSVWVTWRF